MAGQRGAKQSAHTGHDMGAYFGELLVILSAVCFGLMPFLAKIIEAHGGDAYMAAFGRFFFGGLMLFAVLLPRGVSALRLDGRQFSAVFLLSVFYAVTPILLYSSYRYMDSGLATTLHFTFPVMVLVLAALLFRVRPNVRQVVCVLVCIAGVSRLSIGGAMDETGIALSVLSGVTYALYIVFLDKSKLHELPVLVIAFWLSALASVEIAAGAALSGNFRLPADAAAWLAMAALAFVSTVLGLVLFQKGLLYCGAVRASLLSAFEPLTSVFVGCLVFHEVLSPSSAFGIFCILSAGVLLVFPAAPALSGQDGR
ncbi:MAG: EamA family transporter [Schwartzia sp.]|nr:EamA family transporter [Schwartzia sp. (in: firmicutes)]